MPIKSKECTIRLIDGGVLIDQLIRWGVIGTSCSEVTITARVGASVIVSASCIGDQRLRESLKEACRDAPELTPASHIPLECPERGAPLHSGKRELRIADVLGAIWDCPACKTVNKPEAETCVACGERRPDLWDKADSEHPRTLTAKACLNLCLLVTADREFYEGVPELTLDVVRGWTHEQMVQAAEYAASAHAQASDNDGVHVPPLPEHLRPYVEVPR